MYVHNTNNIFLFNIHNPFLGHNKTIYVKRYSINVARRHWSPHNVQRGYISILFQFGFVNLFLLRILSLLIILWYLLLIK